MVIATSPLAARASIRARSSSTVGQPTATLVPSIPYVGKGSLSETLDAAFGDLDSALLLVTDLRLPGVRLAGRIVAAPVDDSLSRLLSMLGAA